MLPCRVPFLELRDVRTHFPIRKGIIATRTVDWVRAVDGVSLTLDKTAILGLVGESGCGKSTLSRTIMQLIPPTSGSILLDGEDLCRLPRSEIRRRRLDFQMVFQDPYASLNPRMTVFTILSEALTRRHRDLAGSKTLLTARIGELMERVGLDPRYMRKYPHEFSGGQRQRIAIARSLAPDPKLIIADEPVSALDVSIQSQILNLLLRLRRELGLTMIFVSHDLSVVRFLADHIAVMNAGRIVEYGPAEEVFTNPRDPYTRKLLAALPRFGQSA